MVHLVDSIEIEATSDTINKVKKVVPSAREIVICSIKAGHDNSGTVFIGGSDPSYPLKAGEGEDGIIVPNLEEIFYNFDTSGDKLHILIYQDPRVFDLRENILKEHNGK